MSIRDMALFFIIPGPPKCPKQVAQYIKTKEYRQHRVHHSEAMLTILFLYWDIGPLFLAVWKSRYCSSDDGSLALLRLAPPQSPTASMVLVAVAMKL